MCNVPRRFVTQADLMIKCESYLYDISVEYILGDRLEAPVGNKVVQDEVAGWMSGSSGGKRVSKRVVKLGMK